MRIEDLKIKSLPQAHTVANQNHRTDEYSLCSELFSKWIVNVHIYFKCWGFALFCKEELHILSTYIVEWWTGIEWAYSVIWQFSSPLCHLILTFLFRIKTICKTRQVWLPHLTRWPWKPCFCSFHAVCPVRSRLLISHNFAQ